VGTIMNWSAQGILYRQLYSVWASRTVQEAWRHTHGVRGVIRANGSYRHEDCSTRAACISPTCPRTSRDPYR
jgi:hypothetical protein